MSDLLTLIAVLTGVQFVARSLRNARDAIRLVPLASITPSMVGKYKTVPLRFVGADTVLMNIVMYIYGRVWISPKARKQVALCDQIVFLNRDGSSILVNHTLDAGTIIQIKLAEGENSRHIRRSNRRCTIGKELTLAILLPEYSRDRYQEQVRCITIRSRARTSGGRSDILPPRMIEWEVIDPTGFRVRTDSLLERHEVSTSAFWLICQDGCEQDLVRPSTGGLFYPYGSTSYRGFLSFCISIMSRLVIVLLLVMVGIILSVRHTQLAYVLAPLIPVLLIYKAARYMMQWDLLKRFRTRSPVMRSTTNIARWTITEYRTLPWHGSTRRSLAVGHRIRRVGFWQQVFFSYWEPSVDFIRRHCWLRSTGPKFQENCSINNDE